MHPHRALLVGLLPLLATQAHAQQVRWARHFGADRPDGFQAVVADPDGSFVACGFRTPPGGFSPDAFLVRVDADGNELWSTTLGGLYDDFATSLVRTPDGGFAVAGRTETGNSFEGWLFRTDAAGTVLWERTYAFLGVDERIHDLIQTADGGFLLSGQSRVPHGPFLDYDFWVVKTDANGTLEWQQVYLYGSGGNDVAHTAVELPGGGFVVAGSAQDSWGPWAIRIDALGGLVWSRTYSTTWGGGLYDGVLSTDGNLAFVGEAVQPVGDVNIVLLRTDLDGVVLAEHFYDLEGVQSSTDVGRSLVERPDDGFAISGYSASVNGGYDVYVMRVDAQGVERWSTFLGGSSDDRGYGLAAANDGSLVVTAWETSTPAGQDAWLLRIEDGACASGGTASFCTAVPHSGGHGVSIGSNGEPVIAGNDFELTASGGLPGQGALFFYGPAPDATPFGDGIRCVQGGFFRLGPVAPFSAGGTLARPLDFAAAPLSSGPGAAVPGGTLYFQLWYRDAAAGQSGFNLSDGLSVTFCP